MTSSAEDSGIGAGFVSRTGIVGLAICILVVTAAVLYSLWAFWPTALADAPSSGPPAAAASVEAAGSNPEEKRVHYLGTWTLDVPTETLFFIVVALAGASGGLIHTLRSLSQYVGARRLMWSWVLFYLFLPVIGALGGTAFYVILRAGLFSPSTSLDQASPFGFAAVAGLVGLFSEQALLKLKQLAEELFTAPSPGPDHHEGDKEDAAHGRTHPTTGDPSR